MKKFWIIIALFMSVVACAQDMPTGWTSYLGLRLYADDAYVSADSANQDKEDIDNWAEATGDSLLALKTRANAVIDFNGNIKDGIIAWADLSSAAKSNIVQTTGSQSIGGAKTFTDGMYTDGLFPNASDTYNIGKKEEKYNRGYFNYVTAGAFIIETGVGTDSMLITFNGSEVDFGNVKITADTLEGISTVVHYSYGLIPSSVGDSSITISLCNDLQILLPGANMPNLEEIIMTGIPLGSVSVDLCIWINPGQDYNVVFQDVDGANSSDGNLQLEGDFDMDAGDMLHLRWQSDYNSGMWLEVARKNNR